MARFRGMYDFYLELMVSVRRWEKFLDSKTNRSGYVLDVGANETEEGVGDRLGDKFALRIVDGNFKWRLTEKEEFSSTILDENSKKFCRKKRRTIKNNLASMNEDSSLRVSVVGTESSVGLLSNADTQSLGNGPSGASIVATGAQGELEPETSTNTFRLKDINLAIRKGEKIAVIGPSSSGMSSLLYAMIGEMIPVTDAQVYTSGSLSYLPQSRWLMPVSIKENILMGRPFEEDLMRFSLEAADLLADLDQFGDGIDTILSDDGNNVSGGQKARIALARCYYQE